MMNIFLIPQGYETDLIKRLCASYCSAVLISLKALAGQWTLRGHRGKVRFRASEVSHETPERPK